jgi:hypothetical protein
VEVADRLDDLGAEGVAALDALHLAVIEDLRLEAVERPHPEARLLEPLRPLEVAVEDEVPELAPDLVGQVAVDRLAVGLPHPRQSSSPKRSSSCPEAYRS